MRQGEPTFVDRGAWIALALSRGPLHVHARELGDILHLNGEPDRQRPGPALDHRSRVRIKELS